MQWCAVACGAVVCGAVLVPAAMAATLTLEELAWATDPLGEPLPAGQGDSHHDSHTHTGVYGGVSSAESQYLLEVERSGRAPLHQRPHPGSPPHRTRAPDRRAASGISSHGQRLSVGVLDDGRTFCTIAVNGGRGGAPLWLTVEEGCDTADVVAGFVHERQIPDEALEELAERVVDAQRAIEEVCVAVWLCGYVAVCVCVCVPCIGTSLAAVHHVCVRCIAGQGTTPCGVDGTEKASASSGSGPTP